MTLRPIKANARRIFVLVLAACHCFAPLRAEEAIHAIGVFPLRDYGIVMGETLAAEVRAEVESGYELETAALPRAGSAASDFLELREIKRTRQSEGNRTVYRITLRYQVFKGVREAETLAVPTLPLRFRRGDETIETQAPAWNFTLNPLIPEKMPDEQVTVREDAPPPAYATTEHWRRLAAFLWGLAILGFYAVRRLGISVLKPNASPFVRAAAGLKSLGRQTSSLEIYRQGARLVHAALNEAAGHTVFSGQLERFLSEFPQFESSRDELSKFFALSDRLFFDNPRESLSDYPFSRLEALCRKLAANGRG